MATENTDKDSEDDIPDFAKDLVAEMDEAANTKPAVVVSDENAPAENVPTEKAPADNAPAEMPAEATEASTDNEASSEDKALSLIHI